LLTQKKTIPLKGRGKKNGGKIGQTRKKKRGFFVLLGKIEGEKGGPRGEKGIEGKRVGENLPQNDGASFLKKQLSGKVVILVRGRETLKKGKKGGKWKDVTQFQLTLHKRGAEKKRGGWYSIIHSGERKTSGKKNILSKAGTLTNRGGQEWGTSSTHGKGKESQVVPKTPDVY